MSAPLRLKPESASILAAPTAKSRVGGLNGFPAAKTTRRATQTPETATGYALISLENRKGEYHTGLWYFRARYFDSELGRFISRDPVGYVDGQNLYAGYFAISFGTDAHGLWSWPWQPPSGPGVQPNLPVYWYNQYLASQSAFNNFDESGYGTLEDCLTAAFSLYQDGTSALNNMMSNVLQDLADQQGIQFDINQMTSTMNSAAIHIGLSIATLGAGAAISSIAFTTQTVGGVTTQVAQLTTTTYNTLQIATQGPLIGLQAWNAASSGVTLPPFMQSQLLQFSARQQTGVLRTMNSYLGAKAKCLACDYESN